MCWICTTHSASVGRYGDCTCTAVLAFCYWYDKLISLGNGVENA